MSDMDKALSYCKSSPWISAGQAASKYNVDKLHLIKLLKLRDLKDLNSV